MEKLIEMMNAGVSISVFGGMEFSYKKDQWTVNAKRNSDGVNLEIRTAGTDLQTCIDDLYEKWLSATGRGLPSHSLKQIEYTPLALDDEIPF